jgi:hypothetical protein
MDVQETDIVWWGVCAENKSGGCLVDCYVRPVDSDSQCARAPILLESIGTQHRCDQFFEVRCHSSASVSVCLILHISCSCVCICVCVNGIIILCVAVVIGSLHLSVLVSTALSHAQYLSVCQNSNMGSLGDVFQTALLNICGFVCTYAGKCPDALVQATSIMFAFVCLVAANCSIKNFIF